jgi:hypothetical protein
LNQQSGKRASFVTSKGLLTCLGREGSNEEGGCTTMASPEY